MVQDATHFKDSHFPQLRSSQDFENTGGRTRFQLLTEKKYIDRLGKN